MHHIWGMVDRSSVSYTSRRMPCWVAVMSAEVSGLYDVDGSTPPLTLDELVASACEGHISITPHTKGEERLLALCALGAVGPPLGEEVLVGPVPGTLLPPVPLGLVPGHGFVVRRAHHHAHGVGEDLVGAREGLLGEARVGVHPVDVEHAGVH
jgi:hypothetical protein